MSKSKKKCKIIAFIPARSGSTRVKNKNIRLIKDRPLIYWSIYKAIISKVFDKIIFSSDSTYYYKLLTNYLKKDKLVYKNLTFDKRDKLHSKVNSKIFDYLKFDLFKKYKLNKDDLLVQMLPTCPLRSVKTIKNTINYSLQNNRNCFSVSEYDFHITFGLSIKNDKWTPVFEKKSPMISGKTQSQTQKKYYHPTGVINCLHVGSLGKKVKSIYQNASPIIISRSESFDIDTEDDLKFIKKIF